MYRYEKSFVKNCVTQIILTQLLQYNFSYLIKIVPFLYIRTDSIWRTVVCVLIIREVKILLDNRKIIIYMKNKWNLFPLTIRSRMRNFPHVLKTWRSLQSVSVISCLPSIYQFHVKRNKIIQEFHISLLITENCHKRIFPLCRIYGIWCKKMYINDTIIFFE